MNALHTPETVTIPLNLLKQSPQTELEQMSERAHWKFLLE
jgi:hypothetical protein